MRIYNLVEEQIRQAIEDGDFDNLPGKGKPIDLTEWERTPPELRMSYSILKSAGIPSAEVDIRRNISEIKAAIAACDDPEERTRLINLLNQAMTEYSLKMDRLRRR
ncbi:MAG: DUF1992 domain-containing protein [Gammaproteobacteria bacterium]|nr:DUF1992 domain-containing protein [Gammaproteobacteria bacterium]